MKFIKINKNNWKTAAFLTHESDIYIASNLYSIAEAQFYPKASSRAIEVDGEIAGYTLFGEDEDNPEAFFVDRFMIGIKHRRRGYGRKAMNMLIDLWKKSDYPRMETSTATENIPMQKMLESCGFSTDGEIRETEIVYYMVR